jgi:hypothetical protein
MFIDHLSPGRWSPLVAWADFLQDGGRLVIGVILAIVSIAAAEYTFANSDNLKQDAKSRL